MVVEPDAYLPTLFKRLCFKTEIMIRISVSDKNTLYIIFPAMVLFNVTFSGSPCYESQRLTARNEFNSCMNVSVAV